MHKNKIKINKKCPRCKIIKPISEWRKNKASNDGLQTYCYKCRIITSRIYVEKNKEKIYETNYKHRVKRRLQLLKLLGKKCVHCNEYRVQFLQIDHVYNDGGKERKERNERGMSLTVMNDYINGKRDINRLQILCANCNYKKQYLSNKLLNCIEEMKILINWDDNNA